MAGLDDLFAQIPTSEIANQLGADQAEVENAVHTLVPVLLSGLQENSEDPEHASKIESAAASHAASGLLDVGGGAPQVDEGDGRQAVASLFGGTDSDQVASALAKGGAGDSALLKQLLPIVVPIVLAYVGRQLGSSGGAPQANAPQKAEASGGVLGEVLGSILSSGSGNKSLGSILGGKLGGGLGDIIGGMLGGKK